MPRRSRGHSTVAAASPCPRIVPPESRYRLPDRVTTTTIHSLSAYRLKLLSKEALVVHSSDPNNADRPVKSGPARSPLERLLRLGSLVGRVGASVAVEQLLSLVRSGPSRQLHQVANLVLNAERIVHDLGELKGAAMKVGQMLSLQDSLLPPEVTCLLRALQQQAPPIPFDAVKRHLDAELPGWRKTIKRLEPAAIAAGSSRLIVFRQPGSSASRWRLTASNGIGGACCCSARRTPVTSGGSSES